MKSKISLVATISVVVILLMTTQCKKDGFNPFVFYTTVDTSITPMTLYINGAFVSQLPYTADKDDSVTITSFPTYILSQGGYNIEAKDKNGVSRVKMSLHIVRSGYSWYVKLGRLYSPQSYDSTLTPPKWHFEDIYKEALDLYY